MRGGTLQHWNDLQWRKDCYEQAGDRGGGHEPVCQENVHVHQVHWQVVQAQKGHKRSPSVIHERKGYGYEWHDQGTWNFITTVPRTSRRPHSHQLSDRKVCFSLAFAKKGYQAQLCINPSTVGSTLSTVGLSYQSASKSGTCTTSAWAVVMGPSARQCEQRNWHRHSLEHQAQSLPLSCSHSVMQRFTAQALGWGAGEPTTRRVSSGQWLVRRGKGKWNSIPMALTLSKWCEQRKCLLTIYGSAVLARPWQKCT